jgi:hypothetical protein
VKSLRWIGIGIGLVFGYFTYNVVNLANTRGKVDPTMDFSKPRHPVTPEMVSEVKKLNLKTAKLFKLPNTRGKLTAIGGSGPRPQFIYAIKKGCPCSFDAEPLMQALYKHFQGKIEFVGVTDAEQKDALKWESDLRVPYAVVSNPKVEVMQEYQFPASVYCHLVDTRGVIVKRWAGYSRSYLAEMNVEMATLLKEKPRPFDSQYAPEANTSGCSYEGYKPVFVTPEN